MHYEENTAQCHIWRKHFRQAARQGLFEVTFKLRSKGWEEQHSWLRQGLIQRLWGWNEPSAVKDQEGACGWFGASDRRVIEEVRQAQAIAEGFCHAAEVLFICPQCSYWCWTFTSFTLATVTSFTRPASEASPICTLSHLMPTRGLGSLSLKVTLA